MARGVDMKLLGERLRSVRKRRDLTLQDVSSETKISIPTLSRIERGDSNGLKSTTLLTLAGWMGIKVEKMQGSPAPVIRNGKVVEDTPDIVELHLRADKKLDSKTVTILGKLFRTAYEQLSNNSESK